MTNDPAPPAESPAPRPVGAGRRTLRVAPEGTLPKVLRLATFLSVVSALVVGVSYHRVRGQLNESLLGAGAQIAMIEGADHQDAPREVVLNGQHVHFSTGVTTVGVEALLDRFAARCEALDAGISEQLLEALARHPDPEREARLASWGGPVLRDMNGGHGYVACLDLGATQVPVAELYERIAEFGRTRDLHDVGDLRYLYAEPIDGGARTHFATVWTEGSLRFDEIFPDEGDARGADPANVPRPPGARRMLSAFESGDSQRATFYQTTEIDEGALARFYRRELPGRGWSFLDAPNAEQNVPSGIRPALVARRGDSMLWVTLSTDPQGRVHAGFIETEGGDVATDGAPHRATGG